MRIMLLICYLFLGVTHASEEVNQPSSNEKNKQAEALSCRDYSSMLNALQEKNGQLESKLNEMEVVFSELESELETTNNSEAQGML